MNKYGDCSSDIQQNLKIVTFIELEIIEPEVLSNISDGPTNFIVEMFPCELPQFLLPAEIYESKRESF